MSDDLPAWTRLVPPRFRVEHELGRGTSGIVLAAHDQERGHLVALKLLRDAAAIDLAARMEREADALHQLDHPNVVRIHEALLLPSGPLLVMELLEGAPFHLAPPGDHLEWMLGIAEGLTAIHRRGWLHRDIKPANCFRCTDGRVVILDLGLVRDPAADALTATGEVVGTMAFLAPEVLWSRQMRAPMDWYAWGISLYWLYERRSPVTLDEVRAMVKGSPPPPLVFEKLEEEGPEARVIRAATHPTPSRRPRNARELRELVAGHVRAEPGRTRPIPEDL